jgi:GNAT superfamily N-acetyltransferase
MAPVTSADAVNFQQIRHPYDITDELRRAMADCWIEVSNAGGAAGFPFPPVGAAEVAPAVGRIVEGLAPDRSRLLIAHCGSGLAGWLNLCCEPGQLLGHWGTVHHVQTRTALRGRGIGVALMTRVREIARDEMGLQQLHLAARGGMGLEGFYIRLGWKEIGRWPGALRLAPGDDRDEILMLLSPL